MMNRRQALRNIGLGAGYVVAAPTLLSILQSCSNEVTFTPVFLKPAEGFALQQMVNMIIPSDDKAPGAKDVNVAEFIDRFWNEVRDEKDQERLRKSWAAFAKNFKGEFNKELDEGKPENYDKMLTKYLKASPEDRAKYTEISQGYSAEDSQEKEIDLDAGSFGLLEQIRSLTIWGWKTSEEVGENLLWYDPVPGQYLGCVPTSEAGDGKVMSL